MTKSTRVNFINQIKDSDLVIAPANSSKGRWKTFTVKPGKTGQITDSNGGRNNYDVEFTATLRQGALVKNDKLIGTYRFDNPWMQSGSNMSALDKYVGMSGAYGLGRNNGINIDNVTYYGAYIKPDRVNISYGTKDDQGYTAGKINTNGLSQGPYSKQPFGDYFSKLPFTAFLPGEPVANIKRTTSSEYSEYNFWASPAPNPGLFN